MFPFLTSSCYQLLHARNYMFPICIPLQGIQVNLDARKDQLQTSIITSLKNLLHHIISKRVFHHSLQIMLCHLFTINVIHTLPFITNKWIQTCKGSFSSEVPSISFTKIWRSSGLPKAKHFSITLEANFCWLILTICPASLLIIAVRSCGLPCSTMCYQRKV